MTFFSKDYVEARNRFCSAAITAGAQLDQLKIQAQGPLAEPLTIDIAIYGDRRASKILLHSSGVHGVEGFAGSAVQLAALNQKIALAPDTAIIFAHILNPYGMSHLRRVNENNVDLNRNFLAPGESYSGPDDSYKEIDKILNYQALEPLFWLRLGQKLLRHGFATLKKTIAQGQYDFPAGVFFGGSQLQEGPKLYQNWLTQNIRSAKKVAALDVHSGLGRFGEEVLFCHLKNAELPDIGKKITPLSANVGYKVRGGMESLTAQVFANAEWVHFTEEFGTYSMIQVLRALREENMHFRNSKKSGFANFRLKHAMNPENQKWQQIVVTEGLVTINRLLAWLAK